MNVYLVRKVVSYKKDIFGTFASKKKAIENAKRLAREQKGTNLMFDVVSMPMECFKSLEKNGFKGHVHRNKMVFSSVS